MFPEALLNLITEVLEMIFTQSDSNSKVFKVADVPNLMTLLPDCP